MEDSKSENHKLLHQGEIAEFYSGKHIFITGSSGFMGVVLLEKLLRSCPNLEAIYVLLRPKRGKTGEERIDKMVSGVLYDELRRIRGDSFRKCIIPIIGDVSKPGLNISKEDRLFLTSKVEIIIHNAANATFNKPLKLMTETNVRGTKCVIELARECRNLQALVHVSTAYSNCLKRDCIEETFYDPPIDPQRLIDIVDKTDARTLEILTTKILGNYPNTYSYTKQVAENLIKNCGLPSCVFRPSIVVSSYSEPLPGWCNNLYGFPGLVIACGLGIMHSISVDENHRIDIVPVDMSINALIACGWEVAKQKTKTISYDKIVLKNHVKPNATTTNHSIEEDYVSKEVTTLPEEKQEVSVPLVYNYVSCTNPITWKGIFEKTLTHGEDYTTMRNAWYYFISVSKNRYKYLLLTFLQHFLPAFFVDTYLYLRGKKTMALNFYTKIFITLESLVLFHTREWDFGTKNIKSLSQRLSDVDRSVFPMDIDTINWDIFLKNLIIGLRVIVVGDDLSTIPAAKKRLFKLKILHYTVVYTMYLLGAWLLWIILRYMFF